MNIQEGRPPGERRDVAPTDEVRILRPVEGRDHWPRQAPAALPIKRVAVLDTETTGIDPLRHTVIELCIAMCCVDAAGRIVAIEQVASVFNDPGVPLTPEVAALTGITNEMIAGEGFNHEQVIAHLLTADYVVSYNAAFDRAHLEQLLPDLPALPWACAMNDIPYRELGFEPGPQGYLLAQCGRYNPNVHRAIADVQSLVNLLAHEHSDGETLMAKLLRAADEPAWRLEATDAPYRFKGDLKEWLYAFSGKHKLWHKHVRPSDFRAEYARYRQLIGQRPSVVPLPASERYRADWTWKPAERRVEVAAFRR